MGFSAGKFLTAVGMSLYQLNFKGEKWFLASPYGSGTVFPRKEN
ncbi:MAG: hypothetical protein ACI8P3_000738 [Saprospiraceae bacterium]|jgi:hypothetical protein